MPELKMKSDVLVRIELQDEHNAGAISKFLSDCKVMHSHMIFVSDTKYIALYTEDDAERVTCWLRNEGLLKA